MPQTVDIKPFYPDVDFGTDDVPDLYEMTDALRESGVRAAPILYHGEIAWMMIRHDDVYAAYRDNEHFPCSEAFKRHSEPRMGRILLALDGEEHRTKRMLLMKSFFPQAVRTYLERLMKPLSHELIDSLQGQQEVDLVAAYTRRFPLKLICRLLGVPDEAEARLVGWIDELFFPTSYESGQQARQEVTDFMLPIIHARRANPRQDLISELATVEMDGERLDDEDILCFVRLVFPAGADTTYLAMGSLMNHVLGDPDLKARIMDDYSIVPQVVEEALRLYGTTTLEPRYTVTGFEPFGIPPHSVVLFGNGPANRDPDVYEQPHTLVVERKSPQKLTFGGGQHVCIGMHLARATLALSLENLLKRLPGLRLSAGMSPATGGTLRGVRSLPVRYDAVTPASAGVV